MKENEIFEQMPVPKAFFKLALPVVFGMVISLVYNMVDTWFIARTHDTNLVAGVSLCAPVFMLMIAFGDIFGIGGSSIISRLFGEKKLEDAKHVSAFCLYAATAFGIVVAIIMLLFQNPILNLLGAAEDTFTYAADYYKWIAIGSPAIILSIVPNNILRTEGLAADAMIGSVVGSVINIVLDPIFIFTLGMGAGGAALATIISNVISVMLLVAIMAKKSKRLSASIKDVAVKTEHWKGIFLIGLPASITNLMQSFAVMLTNRYLVKYGTDNIAALGIALKVNMIIMLILVGFAFGAQPLLGYNYGAKNGKRLKEIIRFDLFVQLAFSIVCVLIFMIFAPQLIAIFMKDEAVVTAGSLILRCLMITAPCMGVTLVFTTLFQAAGKAMPAFILSISRQGVVFLVCILVMSALFGYYGVILAQAAADVLTMIIGLLLYGNLMKKEQMK